MIGNLSISIIHFTKVNKLETPSPSPTILCFRFSRLFKVWPIKSFFRRIKVFARDGQSEKYSSALFTPCRVDSKAKNCRNTTHKMAESNHSIQGCYRWSSYIVDTTHKWHNQITPRLQLLLALVTENSHLTYSLHFLLQLEINKFEANNSAFPAKTLN